MYDSDKYEHAILWTFIITSALYVYSHSYTCNCV